jgi:hypothetical protein
MKTKAITRIALAMLLMDMLTLAFTVQQVESNPLPQIFLDPSEYTAGVNEVFTIKVNVSDVTDYYGFDMWLHYNSTILNHTAITVDGPGQVAPTNPAQRVITDVSVLGTIKYSCVFKEAAGAPAFNGSGTLAWINFKANNVGSTDLNFNTYWTMLYYPNATIIPMGPPLNGSITVGVPVGGIWISVDKLGLLFPYIALVSTIILAVSISVAIIKYRKK